MLDKNIKDSYFFFDEENKMMLRQPHPWDPNEYGEGDAIGRNFDCYFTYDDEDFLIGISWCFELKEDKRGFYYQGHRYPTWIEDDYNLKGISRDHISYALIAFKLASERLPNSTWGLYLEEKIKGLRFRISDFALFTPDMWCWMHYLRGSKFHGFLYYSMEIPTLLINLIKNKLIYKIGRLGKDVHPRDWVNKSNKKKISKLLMPVFAIHNCSWQIRTLPNSWMKRLLQKILLKMTPKHNYAIRMLNGDYNFSFEDIEDIRQMTGGMWTASFNPNINGRDIHEINCKVNCIDIDYLHKLWEERK